MNKYTQIVSFGFLFFVCAFAQAATLPQIIQTCQTAGQCIGLTTSYVNGDVTAYDYVDTSSGTPTQKVLVEYNLSFGSTQQRDYFDEFTGAPIQSNTPIGGSLWISLNKTYDLTNQSHRMSMFFDQTSEGISGLWGYPPSAEGELILGMGSADLLNGTAFTLGECCSPGSSTGGLLSYASLALSLPDDGQAILPCLADGCGNRAVLNLLNLQYLDIGGQATLVFNDLESRNLLYEIEAYGPDAFDWGISSTSDSYLVNAVPLPASVWLLMSGLALLGYSSGRKVAK